MFYMPPNAKLVHITSSIGDVGLQEVVGVAKNDTNYNEVSDLLFHFLKQMQCA